MKSTTSKSSSRKPAGRASNGTKSSANGSKSSANGSKSSANGSKSKNEPQDDSSKLHKLFEEELKDIYWAEKALTKAIPKMIKNATSEELIEALEDHLEETEEQVKRCEQVFEILGKSPQAKKCEAMAGLIKEAEELMSDSDKGVMRDAAIISAAQKVEHYEIASYGTLRTFAKTLGLDDAADLLEETLNEEKNADETLTGVAESAINVKAANTAEGEEEEEEEQVERGK
jgi:ferritin-like metal-binding protein YciE